MQKLLAAMALKPKLLAYNVLNGVQVILGVAFQVLLARRFGASALSDVYFVSNTAVSFIAAFGFFFTSMFMQYYNDLKVQDRTEATHFYQAVLNVSCILGFCIFALVGLFSGPIIGVFVTGFDPERLTILTVFFRIVAFSLFSATVISLNNSLLNAEMKFMLPYILNLIRPAASISCLLVLVEPFGFYSLAFCIVGSDLLALLVQQIYITKTLGIAPGRRIRHKDLKRMAKKSFSMRIGSQIWSLRDPIATNVLSHFPAGVVSLYYYAMKLISLIATVANSPIVQVYSAKVSGLVSRKEFYKINRLLRETVALNTGFYLAGVIPCAFLLPRILSLAVGKNFSAADIRGIHLMFLALIPFHLIMSVEEPFTSITVAMKQSLTVIRTDVAFIVIYGLLVFLTVGSFGVYAIPFSLMIAQFQNLMAYTANAKKIMGEQLWRTSLAAP
jgi:putative peptidoglycan lipid II flippase